jgi:hypothetical protein
MSSFGTNPETWGYPHNEKSPCERGLGIVTAAYLRRQAGVLLGLSRRTMAAEFQSKVDEIEEEEHDLPSPP